jgi:hypothetical protein
MTNPTTKRATKADALRRWLIAGLVAALAVPSALWTERRAISRRITIARLRRGTQGFVSLEEQEVGALCALAATLGGLSPAEPSFTAYARPLIQRAVERIPGAGFAMRNTLHAIDEHGGTLDAALAELLARPRGWRRFSPSARSAYVDMEVTQGLLRRIALTSPHSWARVGYVHFPGVPGPMTDYLSPPAPRVS